MSTNEDTSDDVMFHKEDLGRRPEILNEIGATRPDSEEDKLIRELHIKESLDAKVGGILKMKGLDKHGPNFDPNIIERIRDRFTAIIPSAKQISEYLEPEYIIAANLMYEDHDITTEEALDKARKFLYDRNKNRENRGQLTHGLEIELSKDNPLYKGKSTSERIKQDYLDTVDSLQELGIMIDNDALREMKLSKSYGPRDQIRYVQELIKFGVILKDQKINLHFNVAGFEDPQEHLGEFSFIHLLFAGSSFFTKIEEAPEKPLVMNVGGNKGIYDQGALGISNIPIRLRDNDVVEFRGLFKRWESLSSFARSMFHFDNVCNSLRSFLVHSKTSQNAGNVSQWEVLKRNFFSLVENYGHEKDIQELIELESFINQLEFLGRARTMKQRFKSERRRLIENYRNSEGGAIDYDEYIASGDFTLDTDEDLRETIKILKDMSESIPNAEFYKSIINNKIPHESLLDMSEEELFNYLKSSNKIPSIRLDKYMRADSLKFPRIWQAIVAASTDDQFRGEVDKMIRSMGQ